MDVTWGGTGGGCFPKANYPNQGLRVTAFMHTAPRAPTAPRTPVRKLELMMRLGRLPMSWVNVIIAVFTEPAAHRLVPEAYVTVTP